MKNRFLIVALCGVLWLPQNAWAVGSAGYENAVFSGVALSQSNAVVAQGEEPAAISYNPAAIVDLPGLQIEDTIFFESVITHANNRLGGHLQSSGTLVEVPTGYITVNPGPTFNDRLAFGIGADVPFGLTNKYPSRRNAVRYTGYTNYIKLFAIKPVIAFKAFDWLTIGAGPVYYRLLDVGGYQAYPNVLAGGGLDGEVQVHLHGDIWGWHMGLQAKPSPKHSFGFYFRSPVTANLRGRAEVTGSSFKGNFHTGVNSKFNIPLNFTWGYAYHFSEKTTAEVDFGYTRWGNVDGFHVFADPTGNASDDAILNAIGQGTANDYDYQDSYSVHLGGSHELHDRFTLRGGTLYYSRAVANQHFRPSMPDSNRWALSGGFSWEVLRDVYFDMSYMLMLGLTRKIDNDITEALGTTVDGKYFSVYQIFSAGVRVTWEDLFGRSEDGRVVKEEKKPEVYYSNQGYVQPAPENPNKAAEEFVPSARPAPVTANDQARAEALRKSLNVPQSDPVVPAADQANDSAVRNPYIK